MLTIQQKLSLIGLIDDGIAPQDADIRQALLDSGAVELIDGTQLRPTDQAAERLREYDPVAVAVRLEEENGLSVDGDVLD